MYQIYYIVFIKYHIINIYYYELEVILIDEYGSTWYDK